MGPGAAGLTSPPQAAKRLATAANVALPTTHHDGGQHEAGDDDGIFASIDENVAHRAAVPVRATIA
jgi:hypothetical protein